jgi:adenylyltransferase/sulfurtransferase
VVLDALERARYLRQVVIPEIGESGQAALRQARVLVVGAGGLGSPVLLYLAAAGVGRLGVVDYDVVDRSNLQRQIVHGTPDIGRPKTDSAADRIAALNPSVTVVRHALCLDQHTVVELLRAYDVIVTAVDNLSTRYLLNDACVLLRKTLVEGAVLRFVGLAMTIKGGQSACYRCVFPQPPAPEGCSSATEHSATEQGVFGPVPGVIGAIQAAEALKAILGLGEPLVNRLLQYDALQMTFDEVTTSRDPACPVCGERPSITDIAQSAASLGL